jgi:hypothetical protein
VRDRPNGLHRDALLGAHSEQRLELGRVPLVLHLPVAVREQHRVDVEALECEAVHRRDRQPVAGDAAEADKSLVACFDEGPERAALAQRRLPLDRVGEAVEPPYEEAVSMWLTPCWSSSSSACSACAGDTAASAAAPKIVRVVS